MSTPTTPAKKGEAINEIVRDLNSKWSLRLPVKSELWSPSTAANATEEKIFKLIRILYWKNHESLQQALDRFDEHAIYTASQWRFKPRADTETLPARHPSESQLRRDSFLRRQDVPPSAQLALKQALLRFLEEVKRDVCPDKPPSLSSPPAMEPVVDRLPPLSHTSRLLFGRTQQPGCNKYQSESKLTSSDDFSLSPATADIYKTTGAIENTGETFHKGLGGGQSAPSNSDQTGSDEVFTTPPTTPPSLAARSARRNRSIDLMFMQKPDLVKLPERTLESRKRSTVEFSKPSFPEKAARERKSHESPRLYTVSHMEPRRDLNHSFDSILSQSSSFMTTSTMRTTPNTSFYGTTIFELSSEENDLASLQLRREAAAGDHIEPMKHRIETVEDPMEIDTDIELTTVNPMLHHGDPITAPAFENALHPNIEDLGSFPISKSMFTGLDSNPEQFSGHVVGLEEQSLMPERSSSRIIDQSPFLSLDLPMEGISFRSFYEITRVALHYNFHVPDLLNDLQGRSNVDYDDLWCILSTRWLNSEKSMPERSSPTAWERAERSFQGVALSGELSYSKKSQGTIFDFQLKPMKFEQSYRLSREFGGDRFFVLGIPGLDKKDLPSHLRKDAVKFRSDVVSWIANIEHRFLGRSWRAFFVRPQKPGKGLRRQNTSGEIRYRVFFFAVDGQDFPALNIAAQHHGAGSQKFRQPMSVEDLLDWFMPARLNLDQPVLKLFARLQLAVSTTIATIAFEPRQFIHCYDAFAASPGERRLTVNRHRRRSRAKVKDESSVMNDGCARISRAAATAIAAKLNLNGVVPSVYQGRIGGAKGIWMIDAQGEKSPRDHDEIWIEITDSQLKFEGHDKDKTHPEVNRVTFEVIKYSKTLVSSYLNFQLIPILIDGGVPSQVFKRLLKEYLTAKVAALEHAMDDGLRLRQWNQENKSVTKERLRSKTIEMTGGLPSSAAERINWFTEHGFEPKECSFLNELCYKAADKYCQSLEKKMQIGVGRSTTALMIADPLGILKEGEVHLGFSSSFHDEKSGFQDTILNGMDVLVARNPALLPSDIQKVHATFKTQLSVYKDVIIFSSRGKHSLAEKLSGGDFDGDMAWICWEPEIVKSFTNCGEEDYVPKDLDYYGIFKDNTKVSDMIDDADFITRFLHKGFDFNMMPDLLGRCTMYHQSYCYREGSIRSAKAKDVANLLGKLVDGAKGGFVFTEEDWRAFKRKCQLPMWLDDPAHKANGDPTEDVIDQLVLVVAKEIRKQTLSKFIERFKITAEYDDDLVALWKEEAEAAQKDKELDLILKNLVAHLKKIHDFWVPNVRVSNPNDDGPRPGKPPLSFTSVAQDARSRFLAIKPLETSTHILAQRWRKEPCEHWAQLKASALFYNRNYSHWSKGGFPWYVAGKELGDMKVARSKGGGERIVKNIHLALKMDAKFARRMDTGESHVTELAAEVDEWDDDDFDGWDEL